MTKIVNEVLLTELIAKILGAVKAPNVVLAI